MGAINYSLTYGPPMTGTALPYGFYSQDCIRQDLDSLPGGTILRVETKERECWKFLDQRLISENDSRFHGQPSNAIG